MRSLVFVLSLIVLASSCKEEVKEVAVETPPVELYDPVAPGIEELQGLVGAWQDALSNDSSIFYENWTQDEEGMLAGIGYVMSGDDTVRIEHLKITFINEEFLYNARIDSQNRAEWVSFLLMPSGPDTLKFFNNMHDFPQEILYAKENDSWKVRVSNDSGDELNFHLIPKAADSGS